MENSSWIDGEHSLFLKEISQDMSWGQQCDHR